jgi:hypothetical protein
MRIEVSTTTTLSPKDQTAGLDDTSDRLLTTPRYRSERANTFWHNAPKHAQKALATSWCIAASQALRRSARLNVMTATTP